MADITYTLTATERRNTAGGIYGKGDAANAKSISITRNVTAQSQNSTIFFKRIPSNARISGISKIHWDDLDNTNSLTLDVGLASVDSNITSDPDALNDGLDATSAGSGDLIKDHANFGKQAWEFVNGVTEDPRGLLDIYVTLADAASDVTGDITIELVYTID